MKKLKIADLKTNKQYLFYYKYRKEWLLGIFSRRAMCMVVNEEDDMLWKFSTPIYCLPKLG